LTNLIKISDTSKYLTKGIISKTIIMIAKKDPSNVIQELVEYLDHQNIDIRLNAINSIDGLIDEYLSNFRVKPFFIILQNDKNLQIKKQASKIISKIAQKDPNLIKPFISDFFQSFNEQELTVRIALSKSLLEIVKISPEIIPARIIINLLSDQDSFIRETSAKILGYIGYKMPFSVADALIKVGLIDDEWIVREAAASSLGKIIPYVENKDKIIQKLVSLMDDEQNWVRRTAMNILSTIKEVNRAHIPFETLAKHLTNEDENVREASVKLLEIYGTQIFEKFDSIVSLLGDSSKEVRTSLINSLVNIIKKEGITKILSKLLRNLSAEGSLEIQQSISIILGRTIKYEDTKIKKRVIALLKVRCEMTQDPIICETLNQLKES
jgi:HEAT repeat protein